MSEETHRRSLYAYWRNDGGEGAMPRGIRKTIDRTVFVAKETFMTVINDVPVTIVKGTTVRAGHALHLGREMLFAPLKVEYEVARAAETDPEPDPEPEPVQKAAPEAETKIQSPPDTSVRSESRPAK